MINPIIEKGYLHKNTQQKCDNVNRVLNAIFFSLKILYFFWFFKFLHDLHHTSAVLIDYGESHDDLFEYL